MTCEWCGHEHAYTALCTERPKARGMTRRSFAFLFGAGVAGLALAPSLPRHGWIVGELPSPWANVDAFGRLTAGLWNLKIEKIFGEDDDKIGAWRPSSD